MSEARRHAITASELLTQVESHEERLRGLSDDERLQMVVTGGFSRANADKKWTVEVATAHALVALALSQTEETS